MRTIGARPIPDPAQRSLVQPGYPTAQTPFRGVRRTVRQGFWLTLLFGVLFTAIIWNGRHLLVATGQDPAIALLAQDYLQAVAWGLVPSLWFVVLRCFVTAHSRPRSVLVIMLLAVAVNAVSNYGLMFGNFGLPRWELTGAGVTSSVVSALMFLALLATTVVGVWKAEWTGAVTLALVWNTVNTAALAVFLGIAVREGAALKNRSTR